MWEALDSLTIQMREEIQDIINDVSMPQNQDAVMLMQKAGSPISLYRRRTGIQAEVTDQAEPTSQEEDTASTDDSVVEAFLQQLQQGHFRDEETKPQQQEELHALPQQEPGRSDTAKWQGDGEENAKEGRNTEDFENDKKSITGFPQ